MKWLLCLLLVVGITSAQAQSYWSTDSLEQAAPNFAMDRYHDILRYHNPIMYLAYPYVQNATERRVPLQEGEGKNGYLLEGNMAYRFVIHQGKYYSYSLLQRTRLTFDAGLTVRLTNDYSEPLLPMSAKFGLGLDVLLSRLDQLKKDKASIVWTTLQLHHYSNGQSDSFFIENPVRRNNYKGGDFSTNYIRGMLNVAFNTEQKNIITASVGYQNEVDLGGPLVLSKELNGYYGLRRLLIGVQWAQKPRLVSVNVRNRATKAEDIITLPKRRQFLVRTELEYILDDVSHFVGDNPQRLGAHAYVTYMPSVTNEVGFMIHGFYGRDYLNIRFDDVVFVAEIGVCVKFNPR
jgi:hypothetical protein